eukprot:c22225_g1_i3 orf=423-1952(+)
MEPMGKAKLKSGSNMSVCTNCAVHLNTAMPLASLSNYAETVTKDAGRTTKGVPLMVVAMGVLIASLIVLALFLCWLVFCSRKVHQSKHDANGKGTQGTETQKFKGKHTSTVYTRNFSLKELEKATNFFSSEYVVGSGAFGLVYKAVLDSCEVVAIKRARQESYQDSNEFQNEVKFLSKMRHKHLVNLIGFCEERGEQMLVYEYMPNGSLLDHLVGHMGMPLTWRQRVQIAVGVAKGIAYLHDGCSPPIIHGDIKPSNILLDCDYVAKVSDFGLSKNGPAVADSHISTQVKGMPDYLDPQNCLSYQPSTPSDVYSFGIILLQLLSAKPVVDHSRNHSEFNIVNWARNSIEQGRVEDILDPRLLAQPYNRHILLEMGRIGLLCASENLKARPTTSMISHQLEIALQQCGMPQPCQPENSPAHGHRNTRWMSSGHHQDAYSINIPDCCHFDEPETLLQVDNEVPSCPANVQKQKSADKSFSCSVEKFDVELDDLSYVKIRCFDSAEWEDYHV